MFLERNLRGEELEKLGQMDSAIALYEANVMDGFEGAFPYERLRIIYRKARRFQDAIRVCEAYDAMAKEMVAAGIPSERFTGTFTVWASKMRTGRKQDRQAHRELKDVLDRYYPKPD